MDTLPAQVLAIARRTPSKAAFVHHGKPTSYGRFWQIAARLALELQVLGIDKGDRVAILLPNLPETAATIYGIWLAGGIAVPLNPQGKSRDLTVCLAHSGARHLVASPDNAEVRSTRDTLVPAPNLIDVEALANASVETAGRPEGDPSLPAAADLALILYTSGTTGAPKGVALTHGNLLANARAVVSYLRITADDNVLSVLPFYYAYGASVLHTHLLGGATIHLAENAMFPPELVRQLRDQSIAGFSAVPSTYALLLEKLPAQALDLPSLRYITQAGGAMPKPLLEKVRTVFPNALLYVMYGQTEATSRLTWLPPDRLDDKTGSVGIPVCGVEIRIATEDGGDARTGELGEVCARGPNIMAGYWQSEAATREVIRDGWLHTGDLGRLDDDGYLFLEGRRSDMIKTGGNRVSPGDVEEVLLELPAVSEAAVVGVDDSLLGQVIKAYVVLKQDATANDSLVKRHCKMRLPHYKVPKDIAFVDALPKTASGKIRRAALNTPSVPT